MIRRWRCGRATREITGRIGLRLFLKLLIVCSHRAMTRLPLVHCQLVTSCSRQDKTIISRYRLVSLLARQLLSLLTFELVSLSLLAHSVADLVVEGSDWTSKILLGNRGEYLSLILSWFHISEESQTI